MVTTTTSGRSLAHLDRGIAEDFGRRLKSARLLAGLTQARLAEPRYTKAYISALEHGHAKPSMAALNFLSQRLGVSPTRLLEADEPRWTRLEADLRLASGDWQGAADAYAGLLEGETHSLARAELRRGQAEALVRLERPAEALPIAADASAVLAAAGRDADAATAAYWQAASLYVLENDEEARSLFQQLLNDVRAGLQVDPDFGVRILISLAAVEGRAGESKRALTYLDEARSLVDGLDEMKRAAFLTTLAMSYRETGDYEGAIGAANQALSRYRANEAERDVSRLENELALVHLALGSVERAREHARLANAGLERLGDDRFRAHVLETLAQVELADGHPEQAAAVAAEALALAQRSGNRKAAIRAGITIAKASRQIGRQDEALAALRAAADAAREYDRPSQLRDVLTVWAALLAEAGDHAGAYDLTREALQIGH